MSKAHRNCADLDPGTRRGALGVVPSLLRSLGGCRRPGRQGNAPKIRVVYMYTETLCFGWFYIYANTVVENQFWLVYMETLCFCAFCIYTSVFLLFVFAVAQGITHKVMAVPQ